MWKPFSYRISYFLFRLAYWICACLPFSVLYRISDAISYLLFHLIKYRYKVILANLRIAFPDWSENRYHLTARAYYRNLIDISLETLKGPSLSQEEILRRYRFVHTEEINELLAAGQSVFIVLGHCANWEWGPLVAPHFFREPIVGIYKPLKNPFANDYLNRLRTTWGGVLTPMSRTGRTIVERRKHPTVFSFIADQTPSDVDNAHWVAFFGRETAFLHGFSKLAWRTGYPVFYSEVLRNKRGHYDVSFYRLGSKTDFSSEAHLTQAYAQALTENIERSPADWLWSHRRWKRRRGTKAVIDYTSP